jgi:hypothetical protein
MPDYHEDQDQLEEEEAGEISSSTTINLFLPFKIYKKQA